MTHLTYNALEGLWHNGTGEPEAVTNHLVEKLGAKTYQEAERLNNKICLGLFCALVAVAVIAKFL